MAIFERQHQAAEAAALHNGDQPASGDNLQEFRLAFTSSLKDNSRFLSETAKGQECAKIAELFGHFDLNGDGYISQKEITKADKTPHKVDGADPHLFATFLSDRYLSLIHI